MCTVGRPNKYIGIRYCYKCCYRWIIYQHTHSSSNSVKTLCHLNQWLFLPILTDNTAAGEIAERDGEASESVNTFEYPTAASFDLPASPTAPEIPLPPEEPPETPVKVPLNRSDPFEEVEERDDESIDFLPYFSAPDGPQKTYYLRELEAEESDEERLDWYYGVDLFTIQFV